MIDRTTSDIIRNRLSALTDEMRLTLCRTAYSPLLRSAGDFSCAIFDAAGQMVVQGRDIPVHLGSMPYAVQTILAKIGDFQAGDVILHNDPYSGGTHLPDITAVTPIIGKSGSHLGFTAVRAHWPDIGGCQPGSYGLTDSLIAEGLLIPPLKLVEKGRLNRTALDLLMANVRSGDERLGDLQAQISASRLGVSGVMELARTYGSTVVEQTFLDTVELSETLMREAIRSLPNGRCEASEQLDGDGWETGGSDRGIRISTRITKWNDSIEVDFSGSDAAVRGPMNAPIFVTKAGVFTAIKMIADPRNTILPNSGAWRPVTVRADDGSVVSARWPSPVVYAGHEIANRIVDVVMKAMADVVPERVIAGSHASSAILILGFGATQGRQVLYETLAGGVGASSRRDGLNGTKCGVSNTMNTPVEVIETEYPIRVLRYELITNSGGPGQFRGGCGVRRQWELLAPAVATFCIERVKHAAPGLHGGEAGRRSRVSITYPDGREEDMPGKGPSIHLPAGAVISMEVAGGGGFGRSVNRRRDAIERDMADGYISSGV